MFVTKKTFEAYKDEVYKEWHRLDGRLNVQRDNFNDDVAAIRETTEKHDTKIASNNKFIRSVSSRLSTLKTKHRLN